MDDSKKRIEGLEKELERFKREAEKASVRERELEETRKAMLYLLEDVEESANAYLKGKVEWEETFDSIASPLLIHGPDMLIMRCNRAYKEAAGLKFKEIIGRPYYEIFPKAGGPFKACTKNFYEKGKQSEEEEAFVPETGRTYKIKFYLIKSPGGENHGIHVMEDITEEKKARERDLLFAEFNEKIISSLDLDFRLRTICETITKLGYKMAWVGLLDEEKKEVVPKAQAGFDEGYLSSIKVRYDDSPLGQGPAGRAVRSRRPEVQNNIMSDERFAPWKEAALKRGYRSCASFPVLDEGRVMACLNVYNDRDDFPERDIDFLQTFANQAALYIRNAMLYDEIKRSNVRMREEMELTKHLLMIAGSTSHTKDIEKLLSDVTHCLRSITGCAACISYIWDEQRKVLSPSASAGLSKDEDVSFRSGRLDTRVLLATEAFESNEPFLEYFGEPGADRPDGPHMMGAGEALWWAAGAKTAVSIPLSVHEAHLGLLVCIYRENRFPGGIKGRDAEIMAAIKSQVSIALEEARLYKDSLDRTMDLSRKIEVIEAMHEIDKAILSTLDAQEVLETSVHMISKVLPCDRATIALADKEKGGMVFAAGFGMKALIKGGIVAFEDTNATEVYRTGRPQYTANLGMESKLLPLERKLMEEGFLSHIRVPLTIKGEVAGTLNVGARRAAAFSHEDLSILEKLASQIDVALDNAKHLKDVEELFLGIVKTLSIAIDAKSPWTSGHSERVTRIALDIGRELGLKEQELKELELAGLLHDIGKLGTYEAILDKPGKLTEEEMNVMKQHPGKGVDILLPLRQMHNIIPAIKYHHEWFDGRGYPEGIKGQEIPLSARILAVADTVDAMGADRPYRKGRAPEVIIEEMKRCSGTQFDPAVVEAFLRLRSQAPVPAGR